MSIEADGAAGRVALIVRKTGIGGCARELTKIALGIGRDRFEPLVACFRAEGVRLEELRAAGVPVTEFRTGALYSAETWLAACALDRWLRQHRVALVHCLDVPASLFGVPVARAAGLPAIASQLSWRALAGGAGRLASLRAVDRLARAVMVNCQAVRRDLIENHHVPPGRVWLCPAGVDTTVFRPVAGPRPHALRGAPLVVGTVCGMRPEKNLPLLLSAFAEARDAVPGMRLAMAGSGPVLPDLRRQAAELGMHAECHFEPPVADAAKWMRAMDIFALPSSVEGFPHALLEAMACGCAVVAARVGGVPELVVDGESGLLFAPGDCSGLASHIRRLAGDAHLRSRLGAAAARRARKEFPLERSLLSVERMYQWVLSGVAGRHSAVAVRA